MGTGGSIFDTGDYLDLAARLNQKTVFIGTGLQISTLSTTYPGQLAYCTATGGGFLVNQLYIRNAANDNWLPVSISTTEYTWRELGRSTLGAAGDSATVNGLEAVEEIIVLVSKLASGASDTRLQFNGDTASNYAYRQALNGAADSTSASASAIPLSHTSNTLPEFTVVKITNQAAQEKLVEAITVNQGTAGAANAPNRVETVGKWANTAAQISSITLTNAAAGDYAANTQIIVLGLSSTTSKTEFWAELGSATQTSAGTSLSVSSFTATKYLMIEYHWLASSTIRVVARFNNDSGTNYAVRSSVNGAADATGASSTSIDADYGGSIDTYGALFIVNISAQEKLVINQIFDIQAAGAANAPTRVQIIAKWANASSAITSVSIGNGQSGDFATTSKIIVLGSD